MSELAGGSVNGHLNFQVRSTMLLLCSLGHDPHAPGGGWLTVLACRKGRNALLRSWHGPEVAHRSTQIPLAWTWLQTTPSCKGCWEIWWLAGQLCPQLKLGSTILNKKVQRKYEGTKKRCLSHTRFFYSFPKLTYYSWVLIFPHKFVYFLEKSSNIFY